MVPPREFHKGRGRFWGEQRLGRRQGRGATRRDRRDAIAIELRRQPGATVMTEDSTAAPPAPIAREGTITVSSLAAYYHKRLAHREESILCGDRPCGPPRHVRAPHLTALWRIRLSEYP
jgi:hypothetical protein